MKACAALAGVVIGLAAVVLVAMFLVVPRLKAGNGPHLPVTSSASSGNPQFGPPPERIEMPKSDIEKMRQDIDRKRIPFFHMINEQFSGEIDHAAVLKDVDTLDLVIKKDTQEAIMAIIQSAVAPTARDYGFTRVRFYVRNPVGSVEPYRVIAESSWDANRWNTFLK